jgi:hypothetical protein
MSDRSYDVVVYGATGFVGRLVVQYFAASPSASRLRWAIGGRDKSRLEADEIIRFVRNREFFAKRLSVERYQWKIYGAGELPKDLKLEELEYDGKPFTAWLRDRSVQLLRENEFATAGARRVHRCNRDGRRACDRQSSARAHNRHGLPYRIPPLLRGLPGLPVPR